MYFSAGMQTVRTKKLNKNFHRITFGFLIERN